MWLDKIQINETFIFLSDFVFDVSDYIPYGFGCT